MRQRREKQRRRQIVILTRKGRVKLKQVEGSKSGRRPEGHPIHGTPESSELCCEKPSHALHPTSCWARVVLNEAHTALVMLLGFMSGPRWE